MYCIQTVSISTEQNENQQWFPFVKYFGPNCQNYPCDSHGRSRFWNHPSWRFLGRFWTQSTLLWHKILQKGTKRFKMSKPRKTMHFQWWKSDIRFRFSNDAPGIKDFPELQCQTVGELSSHSALVFNRKNNNIFRFLEIFTSPFRGQWE